MDESLTTASLGDALEQQQQQQQSRSSVSGSSLSDVVGDAFDRTLEAKQQQQQQQPAASASTAKPLPQVDYDKHLEFWKNWTPPSKAGNPDLPADFFKPNYGRPAPGSTAATAGDGIEASSGVSGGEGSSSVGHDFSSPFPSAPRSSMSSSAAVNRNAHPILRASMMLKRLCVCGGRCVVGRQPTAEQQRLGGQPAGQCVGGGSALGVPSVRPREPSQYQA